MKRRFEIKPSVSPDLEAPEAAIFSGSFSYGAFDAARDYAHELFPGYEVIPGGTPYDGMGNRKFEAHSDIGRVAILYVKEIV